MSEPIPSDMDSGVSSNSTRNNSDLGNEMLDMETPEVTPAPPPPDDIQAGSGGGDDRIGIESPDDSEGFIHVDADQLFHDPTLPSPANMESVPPPEEGLMSRPSFIHGHDGEEGLMNEMQLIHAPKPISIRLHLIRHILREGARAKNTSSQSWAPPPLDLFRSEPDVPEPSGISYLYDEWKLLFNTLSDDRVEDKSEDEDDEDDEDEDDEDYETYEDDEDGEDDEHDEHDEHDDEENYDDQVEQNQPPVPHNPFDAPNFSDSDSDISMSTPTYKSINIIPKLKSLDSASDSAETGLTAAAEWERQKRELGEENRSLDQLMALEGLEEVKKEFLKTKAKIDAARKRKGWLRRQDLNLVLQGNPGTGKRTVADLYRGFLVQCHVWPNLSEDEVDSYSTTGYLLQTYGDIDDFELKIKVNYAGMFILIDAADYTDEDMRGRLLSVLETHAYKMVVVLTGTVEGMTTFLGSKPSGRWQFSRRLELKDYDDEELYRILLGLIRRNSLTVDGEDSRYALVAAKRVGRGRDSAGFGNAHDLVTSFQKMLDRQAVRLEKEWLERPHQDTDHANDQGDQAAKIKGGNDESSERLADNMPNSNVVETELFDQNDGMTESNENGSSNPKDPENRAEQNIKHQSDKSDRMSSCSDNGAKELHQEDGDNEGTKSDPELDRETKQDDNDTNPGQRVLTMEDIIGPEPIDIRTQSTAWKELEKMAGLEDVKGAIGELLVRAKANYRRELRGKDPLKTTLNRVFLGPPGTGKTTVARLYGQILADMNILTTHDVVIKTPADFIGQYVGESETKTSNILDSTLGKVLIIDDAHMFYNGNKEGTSDSDEFRLSCVDTLVSKIHNRPGEDRCVILIGYPDRMEVMFQNVNPGLQRRFPLEEAFRFENYSDELLNQILRLKMAQEDIKADQPAMDVAAEVLRRARDRPNFGNGGDVDNLLNQAKVRFRERKSKEKKERKSKTSGKEAEGMAHGGGGGYQSGQDASLDIEAGNHCLLNDDDNDDDENGTTKVVLEREDFDPEWNRGASASEKCQALFKGLIGFEGIIDKFQGFQKTARNMRLCNKDPKESIPFTYVFKGPPGTGKTHTARILGQIFYDMGFLSTSEVVECSASHLIGRYMGHTAPKVLNLFRAALGKVLFIDEAYRLGGGGVRGRRQGSSYEDEAVGELVDCMTKPEFHKKMIVVLAGYDRDMDALMKVNAGLQGRLATEIVFPPMSAMRCREHLYNLLRDKDIEVSDDEPATNDMKEKVLRLFDKLGMTAGWANGRDVQTLAATITERVYRSANEILEEAEAAEREHKTMKNEGRGIPRAKFSISTRDLIEFLKDLLRQRIKRGRPT